VAPVVIGLVAWLKPHLLKGGADILGESLVPCRDFTELSFPASWRVSPDVFGNAQSSTLALKAIHGKWIKGLAATALALSRDLAALFFGSSHLSIIQEN